MVEVVRSTLYCAYALILEELLIQDESDDDADVWLRLTARGMRTTPESLACHLLEHDAARHKADD